MAVLDAQTRSMWKYIFSSSKRVKEQPRSPDDRAGEDDVFSAAVRDSGFVSGPGADDSADTQDQAADHAAGLEAAVGCHLVFKVILTRAQTRRLRAERSVRRL